MSMARLWRDQGSHSKPANCLLPCTVGLLKGSIDLSNVETDCRDRLHDLAPPNRGGFNSTHIHGTHVPVEEHVRYGQVPAARVTNRVTRHRLNANSGRAAASQRTPGRNDVHSIKLESCIAAKSGRSGLSWASPRLVERAGEAAGLPFPVHVHMLRHSCGYALANKGMDTRRLQYYLGHASITNTVRYSAMSPEPFRYLWR